MLRPSRFYFGFSTAVLLTLAGCSPTTPEQTFLKKATEQLILPAYQQLADQSDQLATQANDCDKDDQQVLLQTWRDTMSAWQAVQAIQFGPVREKNLAWEMQFWPDSKNLIAKKMRPLMKNSVEQTSETLQQASVVTHGLPAMEYLLFDDTAKQRADRSSRCQMALLVAQRISKTSYELNNDWQQTYQHQLLSPGESNLEFPTEAHAVAVIIDSHLSQLEQMSSRKLTAALGLKTRGERLNPYLLESWRSQHSAENLKQNLHAIHRFMNEGGFLHYLQQKQHGALGIAINERIDSGLSLIDQMNESLFTQLSHTEDPKAQVQLAKQLQSELEQLTKLFKADIPAALNIQLGFNNNDGD